MACFADINVSQGSVATYARCGRIFNMHWTANLPGNIPVKKNLKSVKNWQNYGHESVAPFFGPPCRITQCYLPPDRGDIIAFTPAEAGTRLSDPLGIQGWVDVVGLLHTEMVYTRRRSPIQVLTGPDVR